MLYRRHSDHSWNMEMSLNKTNRLVKSKDPQRCTINKQKEHTTFNLLGVEITSDENLTKEARNQVGKSNRIQRY